MCAPCDRAHCRALVIASAVFYHWHSDAVVRTGVVCYGNFWGHWRSMPSVVLAFFWSGVCFLFYFSHFFTYFHFLTCGNRIKARRHPLYALKTGRCIGLQSERIGGLCSTYYCPAFCCSVLAFLKAFLSSSDVSFGYQIDYPHPQPQKGSKQAHYGHFVLVPSHFTTSKGKPGGCLLLQFIAAWLRVASDVINGNTASLNCPSNGCVVLARFSMRIAASNSEVFLVSRVWATHEIILGHEKP